MPDSLAQLLDIFSRNQAHVQAFMDKLSPIIATTSDEHKRLYYHHIYEEEEQHLERLNQFLPKLEEYLQQEKTTEISDPTFISLLQDIKLEKFGLHNFLEHLDLSLYEFTDEESQATLGSMLDQTKTDYLIAKDILTRINQEFQPSTIWTNQSEQHHVVSAAHATQQVEKTTLTFSHAKQKKLSVGSLRAAR